MSYTAAPTRYNAMAYACCGRSGLMLLRVSPGLWNNLGFPPCLSQIQQNVQTVQRRMPLTDEEKQAVLSILAS